MQIRKVNLEGLGRAPAFLAVCGLSSLFARSITRGLTRATELKRRKSASEKRRGSGKQVMTQFVQEPIGLLVCGITNSAITFLVVGKGRGGGGIKNVLYGRLRPETQTLTPSYTTIFGAKETLSYFFDVLALDLIFGIF